MNLSYDALRVRDILKQWPIDGVTVFLMSGPIDNVNNKQDPDKVLGIFTASGYVESGIMHFHADAKCAITRTGIAAWVLLCSTLHKKPFVACNLDSAVCVTVGDDFILDCKISTLF